MVDLRYHEYLEIFYSSYLYPCSFSWDYGDRLHSIEHTLDPVEEVFVVAEVEEASGAMALVSKGLEHREVNTNSKEMGKH